MTEMTDEQFEAVFHSFDVDKTGHITQLKMLSFVLRLSGFPSAANLDLLEDKLKLFAAANSLPI